MLKKDLDHELINDQEVIQSLKEADHFYICHYSKKHEEIQYRRCYWDEQSKIWETKDGKIAFTVLAMDLDETEIVGYRTFVNVFNVTGRVAKHPTSKAVQ
jgi:hypothetical protein